MQKPEICPTTQRLPDSGIANTVIPSSPETIHQLLTQFLSTLALAVSEGETFLPDPESYDDLFYKLVESGEILSKFKFTYFPSSTAASHKEIAAIDTLIHVSNHYHTLLEAEKEKGRVGKTLEPREVSKIIR